MQENNKKISIIIPVRNNSSQLKQCLQSVIASTYPDYECIVVDDGSTDDTLAVTQQFPVKIIKISKPHGPAYARNRGSEVASGEILFFIDSDVEIYPDSLSIINENFTRHPEIDAVIGSYDDDPQESSFISQYKNLFHHYIHQNSNENASTFWSGCGAIRREVFLDFEGFNTGYKRPSIEDIELGFRLIAANHNIVLLKQLQVKHLKQWTFLTLLKTEIFNRGVPWTILMLRFKIFPKDLNLKMSQRISGLLTVGLLITVILLVIRFDIPSSTLLLTMFLGLIGHLFYLVHPQKKALIIWVLTIYVMFTAFLLASVADRISLLFRAGLITIFLLGLVLLIMQTKGFLNDFFIKYRRYILFICIGYPLVLTFLIATYYQKLSFLPALMLFILILINHNFYKFFIEKRGLVFTLMVIPLHVLYYLYCEISFILGTFSYFLGRKS